MAEPIIRRGVAYSPPPRHYPLEREHHGYRYRTPPRPSTPPRIPRDNRRSRNGAYADWERRTYGPWNDHMWMSESQWEVNVEANVEANVVQKNNPYPVHANNTYPVHANNRYYEKANAAEEGSYSRSVRKCNTLKLPSIGGTSMSINKQTAKNSIIQIPSKEATVEIIEIISTKKGVRNESQPMATTMAKEQDQEKNIMANISAEQDSDSESDSNYEEKPQEVKTEEVAMCTSKQQTDTMYDEDDKVARIHIRMQELETQVSILITAKMKLQEEIDGLNSGKQEASTIGTELAPIKIESHTSINSEVSTNCDTTSSQKR